MARPHEVIEARGHLIDSHRMEVMFDTIVAHDGTFEIEEFRIGRTNVEQSYMRMRVEAPSEEAMDRLLEDLIGLGCATAEQGDAVLRTVERERCAPDDFYSTTNHRTEVRLKGRWVEVQKQRMDTVIAVHDGIAECRRLRDLRAGDEVVCGQHGIRVIPEAKERDRMAFSFMSHGVSSERQVETAVRQVAALLRQTKAEGKRVVVVAGPVVVHTGAAPALAGLIREGWIDCLLAGNALGVHDAEAALLGTSLGVRHGRRPPGRARPPQPHARDQHDLPLRRICARPSSRARSPAAFSTSASERTSLTCWPAACATTARCPTPSPT